MASFALSNQRLYARFKDVFIEKVVGDNEAEFYVGDYEITPAMETQTLDTSDKFMTRDVVISGVPYSKVSNGAGGTTLIIG